MLGADPITTVAVAPAAAAPPLPAAALTAAAPLVPPSEERDAGPAAASTTAGAAAAAAAGTVAGGEEEEEEEGLVVIEQGLAEQQRQQGADHLDSRSTGSSEADEDDDDWDLCAELERLDASTTQRPASRTRNSNRSVGRRRRTVHADTATAATTTATTRAPTPPGQWADLGDLLRADDEAASGGDDGDEDGDDDADSTTAASTEADEVWLPGGGGEGSCVFWVYRDSWGNEVPYPPAAQALLEREWRAGRDSAHLLPGLGGVDGETGGHYTVRFAAASDQHVQVNRLTGTQRRVKRLTRLPREPKGVGGLVLALKGKAREVKEMGPGGVSKAALARARAAGRALARRAPEKEAVVEGAVVATRRTVSVLHGALRRLYIEVGRVMRDGDGDAETDDEQQRGRRQRRRSRRTAVVTLKRKRGKTKKKAAAEDAVAGIPAAAPRPLLDLEEEEGAPAAAAAAAEPQMQKVEGEEEAN